MDYFNLFYGMAGVLVWVAQFILSDHHDLGDNLRPSAAGAVSHILTVMSTTRGIPAMTHGEQLGAGRE